jgi:glycosyltransferase involved in cell wall biosynthesis
VLQVEYIEMAHLVAEEPRAARRLYVCHESLAVAASRRAASLHGPAALPSWFAAAQAARFERRVLASFDRCVALTAVDAEALRTLRPRCRVDVIPSGIELGAVPGKDHLHRNDSRPTILFVGYFRHEPNVDAARWLAGDILPRVRQEVPSARVRLVGREPPSSVAELQSEGQVEVAGFVADLAGELRAASVVALPLRTGSGLRGKLLEAWAAGCAVVATPIACEGAEAVDGRHCLIAADADAFAKALVRSLRDADLRFRLGAAARLHVRDRFSVDAGAESFERVHRDLLFGGGAG